MRKLPVVSGKQVVKALEKAGYYIHHQKGSHITIRKEEYPYNRVTVPVHRIVKKGTLRSIIRDVGLTIDEFIDLL